MALKHHIELGSKPIELLTGSTDFLFSAEMVAASYGGDGSCQFINFASDPISFSLPVIVKTGMPGKRIVMPALTPFFQLDFSALDSLKQTRSLSIQSHVVSALADFIDQLNPALVELNFLPFYWLPFHHANFQVSPRITYRLSTAGVDLFANLRGNIRRQIKKSQETHQVSRGTDTQHLFALNKASYERKNDPHPFDAKHLAQLFNHLTDNKCGEVIELTEADGTVAAAALFAWDSTHLYYLTGGFRDDTQSSGAMSHVLWQGIQLAKEKQLTFDFEGSMNPGIEYFFRSFGATPLTYFQVRKSNSKLYELYQKVR